jgi:hypothetical protein
LATVTVKKAPFKFFRQDRIGLGLVLGLLAPVLGFVLYYFVKIFPTFTFREFLGLLLEQRGLITGITSISLLANAVLFTLYINAGKDNTAKGVFLTTCLYGIAALLIKIIL